MNHAISINSDKTLVITLPEGTQVDRVMIRKMGTQESKLYWRDEVLDQYKWERDIAIQQLKDLGYGFGEKPKADGDTISRQAAIDAWKEDFKGFVNSLDMLRDDYKGIMEYIDELLSVQSELAKYSPKLDNENGELISRQAAIDAVSEACFELRGVFGRCEDALKALPSAQPRKGKWINNSPVTMKCDQCGYVISDWKWHESNFCPNCGADMRGGQDE